MNGQIRTLFSTEVYQGDLAADRGFEAFNADLATACAMLAQEDQAGRRWSRDHAYKGYTSYASLSDLPQRASAFGALKSKLDRHVAAYAERLGFDLGGRRLKLDSLWANVLQSGGAHSGHIHPNSVLSGVVYVQTPRGSGALRLEDPRLAMMMAAPPRRADGPESQRSFVYLEPQPGRVFIWESWLRHEVAPNLARSPRISLSFNYS